MITIQETLMATNLDADFIPHLLWREFLLGVSKRKVFLGLVLETDVLVGAEGTKISVPAWSGVNAGFTANTITETDLDTSGYTVTNPSTTDTDISIGNIVYVAFRLSTVLREDQPNINWVRNTLYSAVQAILDYVEEAIRDVVIAGAGNVVNANSGGTLAYNDVIDLKEALEIDSFHADEGKPTLVVYPSQKSDITKALLTTGVDPSIWKNDSPIVDSTRGIDGGFAGCNVIVTEQMTPALALLITPQGHRFGPNTVFAWKRRMTIESDREVLFGRDLYTASVRYGCSVVQANAVGLISNC